MPRNNQPIDTDIKERHELRPQASPPQRAMTLRGKKISWAGIETGEPMQRGCDHGAWLEKLAAGGVRHVLMPLNGASEDACLFARRHISARDSAGQPRGEAALYDLEHRDEGFFTRLKFLLESARSEGVLLGLSLFDAAPNSARGPLSPGGNVQGLSLSGGKLSPAETERLGKILETAVGWISSVVRGIPGVYIEVFRDMPGEPSGLEIGLARKIAEAFARHGEDISPQNPGPWVVARRDGVLPANLSVQTAPLDVSRRLETTEGIERIEFSDLLHRAEVRVGVDVAGQLFTHVSRDEATMLRFDSGVLDSSRRSWMWATMFRGYWPVIPLRVADKNAEGLLGEISALARFSLAWARRSPLRPCFDILAPVEASALTGHAPIAAQDGHGRFFVYFNEPAAKGLRLALPPGLYRCLWMDTETGKTVDRCDGVDGGPRSNITGVMDTQARLLIVEPNDAPEAVSSW